MSDLLEQLRETLNNKFQNESIDKDYSKGVLSIKDHSELMLRQHKNGKRKGETTHIPEF